MKRGVQLVAVCRTNCSNTACEHILQEQSLPTAEATHARWQDWEIQFIETTMHRPISSLAAALGRTYYAVSKARSKLKKGKLQ